MAAVADWFRELAGAGHWRIFTAVVDIAAVAFVVYKLLMLAKGTRAWQIMWGLAIFFAVVFLSDFLHLRALNWLLRVFLPLGPVVLVILFYPELRHALEQIGRFRLFSRGLATLGREDITALVDQLTKVITDMSRSKTGALIVIERDVGLDDIIAGGRRMDALVSPELIRTIFYPGSPLHDGAIIIRGNRIVAASCILPLSDSPRLGAMIHTRHKAALGISELSDAVVLVVSEETGTISLSVDGNLHRGLDAESLRGRLMDLLQPPATMDSVLQLRRTMSSAFSRMRSVRSSAEDR